MAQSLGIAYVELDLDKTKFEKQQQGLQASIKNLGANIERSMERSFNNLNIKTDNIYTLMQNKIVKSYERISQAANVSAAEQYRAQASAVAKINALQQEMTKNPLYETLGIRSAAAINAQKEAVISSFNTIGQHVQKGSDEWVRIEMAKNAKLTELNKEMVGAHDMSMAAMTRAVLRVYAAYYVISNGIRTVANIAMDGVKAIDEIKFSAIGIASTITSMQGTSGNVAENYKKNLVYAKALVPVLMKIDASSFANLQDIIKMNSQLALHGVFLDANNKKQIDAFTALSNAVKIFTNGQDQAKQVTQEMRAMFTGMIRPGDIIAMQLDSLIKNQGEYAGGLKEVVKLGLKHGDTLERLLPYLTGIVAGVGDIQKTWEAVGSSIETAWTIMQTKLFAGLYENITESGRKLSEWLNDADNALYKFIERIAQLKESIKKLIDIIPEGTGGPMAMGVIGTILFGPAAGGIIAALTLTYSMLDKLGAMAWKATKEAEIVAGLQAEVARQSGMFQGGSPSGKGVTKGFEITTPTVPPPGTTKEELDAARKAKEELNKILLDIQNKFIKDYADAEYEAAKANDEQVATFYKKQQEAAAENAKILKEIQAKEIQDYADAEYEAAKANDEQVVAFYKSMEEAAKEALKQPQRDADEARKMVTFYKDMLGMEDEYRKAKIDWIEKEAKVKFAGMDKEIEKERWMKEQRLKFEQEIFDDKSKKVQQGLGDMASMFQALSGIYAKDSAEANRMQEAANALIVLQKAVAVVNAVSAISAAAAAPFPAGFVAMASMAAAMGSLLGSIGLTVGGGTYGVIAPAYGQNTSVLGGANGQGSESISKSWELLQNTYDMENTKLTGIWESMKELNSNISGIVKSIVQGDIPGAGIELATAYQNQMHNFMGGVFGVFDIFGSFGEKINNAVMKIPIIGQIFGKISSAIFGGAEEISGTGIIVGENGGSVYPYTRTHAKGGLFHSDKDKFYAGAVNDELTNLFSGPNGIYTTLKKSVAELAEMLGGDLQATSNKVFQAIEIPLAGLDSAGIQERFTEEISKIADIYAKEVFSSIIPVYQQVGEGALETVTRLAIDLTLVMSILDKTGQSFSGATDKALELSESLIDLAGGFDKLKEAANAYYDKFFTDEEKQANRQKSLISIMEGLNLILPDTRAGYRYMTEEIQKAMMAGQEWAKSAFVTMLQAAEAADEYYSTLEEALEDATRAQNDYVESLRNIFLTIQEWLDNLRISDLAPVQSAAEWNRQYTEARSKASLPGATEKDVSDYLNFATQYLGFQKSYGTSDSYQAIYDAVVGDVEGMQAGKNEALELAQRQLEALKAIENNTAISAVVSYMNTNGANNFATLPPEELAVINEQINAVDWIAVTDNLNTSWPDLFDGMWEDSARASGGYADRPTIFGEAGGEWAVPTYEPQRSSFLKKAPKSFWDNLGLNGNRPEGEVTVHSHIYLDGEEIQTCVSKGFKTNNDLIQSARRAVN